MKRVLSIGCLLFSFALAVSLSAQGTAPTAGMKIASDTDYAQLQAQADKGRKPSKDGSDSSSTSDSSSSSSSGESSTPEKKAAAAD